MGVQAVFSTDIHKDILSTSVQSLKNMGLAM
uniref:Uncharacterized protein n=1 Tax=Anguilla anguilla TaxID=7936 RepID=A0A0E9RMN6_ANGAN